MATRKSKPATRKARTGKSSQAELAGTVAAINRSQAVIEFKLDGTIIKANDNFLNAVGYTAEEVAGHHHSMFVDPVYAGSTEYRQFWDKLGRGQYDTGQYRRLGKGGREIWIQASYNPILDAKGKPFKVIKFATDITDAKIKAADYEGQLNAVSKAQAVIEFNLDGTILTANPNFLATLGYSLDEIKGRHHSLFVDPAESGSVAYRQFWEKLGRGEFDTGQYKRVGKNGKEVWIQASYNPIMDMNGKPFKVVKYATDVTAQVTFAAAMKQTVDEAGEIAAAATNGDLSKRIPLAGKTGALESLSHGINDLVETVADVMSEVEKLVASANSGDLTKRIEFEGKGGLLSKIGGGINQLTDNMGEIVAKVKAAASSVTRGADEISQGNANLSQRTEEQASSLEETASSMEQMTSTVKQSADNAGQANQLAVAARDQADKGGTVVAKAVKAMTEINDSSKKIADIIGVIDEIAFQTNLLALNAAVEAARAGEQGRGFAVVASEVRNLAGRSATAAKEIKDLINDSVKKVDEGSSLVAQSGQTLEQIVSAVKKVSDIIAEIAAASQEQSSGIDQVNKAVMQLDEMTQQNAALVEEASAASQSMADQARQLNEMMEKYEVSRAVADAAIAEMTGDARPIERRSAARPWNGGEAKGAPPKSTALSRAAANVRPRAAAASGGNSGGSSEWKEF